MCCPEWSLTPGCYRFSDCSRQPIDRTSADKPTIEDYMLFYDLPAQVSLRSKKLIKVCCVTFNEHVIDSCFSNIFISSVRSSLCYNALPLNLNTLRFSLNPGHTKPHCHRTIIAASNHNVQYDRCNS